MIILNRFLDGPGEAKGGSMAPGLHLLLQGIAEHAIRFDRSDYISFHSDINGLIRKFENDPSQENLLLLTGSVNKTMEEYNRRATTHFRKQQVYMQEIITMLSQAIVELSSSDKSTQAGFRDIEKGIEQVVDFEAFLRLKHSLNSMLNRVRMDFHKREMTCQNLNDLKGKLETQAAAVGAALDHEEPAPGESRRNPCEQVIHQAFAAPQKIYVAIAVDGKNKAVRERFGAGVAQQVEDMIIDAVRRKLSGSDQLQNWSTGALVLLLERAENQEAVRRELSPVLSQRMEATVHANNREVMLPIHLNWTLLAAREFPSAEALLLRIKDYVAKNS